MLAVKLLWSDWTSTLLIVCPFGVVASGDTRLGASKAAVDNLTRVMALELGPHNVCYVVAGHGYNKLFRFAPTASIQLWC